MAATASGGYVRRDVGFSERAQPAGPWCLPAFSKMCHRWLQMLAKTYSFREIADLEQNVVFYVLA